MQICLLSLLINTDLLYTSSDLNRDTSVEAKDYESNAITILPLVQYLF